MGIGNLHFRFTNNKFEISLPTQASVAVAPGEAPMTLDVGWDTMMERESRRCRIRR